MVKIITKQNHLYVNKAHLYPPQSQLNERKTLKYVFYHTNVFVDMHFFLNHQRRHEFELFIFSRPVDFRQYRIVVFCSIRFESFFDEILDLCDQSGMKPDSSCDSGCEVEHFSPEIDGDEAVSQIKVRWSSPKFKCPFYPLVVTLTTYGILHIF